MKASATLCFLVVAASGSSAQRSSPGTGTVMGQVLCEDTHTPCRYATVLLEAVPQKAGATRGDRLPGRPETYSSATDLRGAYRIENIAPGSYFIAAKAAGYLTATDVFSSLESSQRPDDAAKAALAESGLDILRVGSDSIQTKDLALVRGAVLGGLVRYDDGGIAANVRVGLLRKNSDGQWKPYADHSGTGVLGLLGISTTDEGGHFAVYGLPAGVFTVRIALPEAVGVPDSFLNANGGSALNLQGSSLSVFYGNGVHLRDAKSIELQRGERREDLEIEIPTVGLYSVSGSISRGDNGSVLKDAP